MQKLAKRAAQAQRQATKRLDKVMDRQRTVEAIRTRKSLKETREEMRQNVADARRARRDAWEMGPLAPKLDLGINRYGSIEKSARQDWSLGGARKARSDVLEKRCGWAGGVKQLNLAEGDRVVVLSGHAKGKIDRIREIDLNTGSVTLQNINQNAITLPIGTQGEKNTPMPISIGAIRLVYPITNPETGVTKDTIINQLKAVPANMQSSNMSYERWQYGKKWDRVALGANTVIPWPEFEVPSLETKKADTVRTEVDERTFYYNLLSSPLPNGVINELRGPYSRFRTRHEPWYIEKKVREEARKRGRLELLQSMQTPMEEFREMKKALREAEGEPELSEGMLEKLGEHMARKKEAALDAAGVSEVSASTTTTTTTTSPPPS